MVKVRLKSAKNYGEGFNANKTLIRIYQLFLSKLIRKKGLVFAQCVFKLINRILVIHAHLCSLFVNYKIKPLQEVFSILSFRLPIGASINHMDWFFMHFYTPSPHTRSLILIYGWVFSFAYCLFTYLYKKITIYTFDKAISK